MLLACALLFVASFADKARDRAYDNRITFFDESAVCTVIRPGRDFEELAVNRLNEQPLMASPTVAGDSFFIRTEKHLCRVEETTP